VATKLDDMSGRLFEACGITALDTRSPLAKPMRDSDMAKSTEMQKPRYKILLMQSHVVN
jgi:hypothetical protein